MKISFRIVEKIGVGMRTSYVIERRVLGFWIRCPIPNLDTPFPFSHFAPDIVFDNFYDAKEALTQYIQNKGYTVIPESDEE